jgi:hypothetical protein
MLWFGLDLGQVEDTQSGVQLSGSAGVEVRAASRPSLLRRFGQAWTYVRDHGEGDADVYYLGSFAARAVGMLGGCVVIGRWFRAPREAADALTRSGGDTAAPEVAIAPSAPPDVASVRVRGAVVGRLELFQSECCLRRGGETRSFATVPRAIGWLAQLYNAADPARAGA